MLQGWKSVSFGSLSPQGKRGSARPPLAACDAVTVGVRAEHLEPAKTGIRFRIENVELLGADSLLYGCLAGGEPIVVSLRGVYDPGEGEIVAVRPAAGHCHVFDGSGRALTPLPPPAALDARGRSSAGQPDERRTAPSVR
jgi:TOBE domain